ncbi:MAG: ABC transporter permease [Verrucomicrobiota bacterium]
MNGLLRLTWSYLLFNRWKSLILVFCLAITIFLPLVLNSLIRVYETRLTARAASTPMIVGARGDRYDLVVNSLYFTTESPEMITLEQEVLIDETGRAITIPLHVRYTARKHPIVGSTLEYFTFRNLTMARGTLPLRLGDCVLGAETARVLDLQPGDRLLTDQISLYNIASAYPLNMRVSGVLSASGSPDDRAIFTDLKTTWLIQGMYHGHEDVSDNEQLILAQEGNTVHANAAVVEYTEVTEENIGRFHVHGAATNMPITAILVQAHSRKDATLLKSAYNRSDRYQMLVSREVVDELLHIVFQVKRFFDTSFGLMMLVCLLFVSIIVLLSLKIRRREMETMYRMGCSRGTMICLQGLEWIFLASGGLFLASLAVGLILFRFPLWKWL